MESKELGSTVGSPSLLYIAIFEAEDEEQADRTAESLRRDYTVKPTKRDGEGIEIVLEDALCTVELTRERDCIVFLIGVNHLHETHVSKNWQEDLEYYRGQVQPILDILPGNPILLLSVFVGSTSNLDEALNLLQEYSEYLGHYKPSAGLTGDCLIATFRNAANENSDEFLRLQLLLSPIGLTGSRAKLSVSTLLTSIKHLAVNLGNLDRLSRLRQPFFPQIDPAEEEIQERIEAIFHDLSRIRQTESVELETLKSWLSMIMVRFSTLSILSGLMERDQINAETYIDENRNLLRQWSETGLPGYPTNLTMQTMEYEILLKPFKDFVARTERLRTQLETVSEMVRTYLSLGQQEQQVSMLGTIESHEKLLKRLTWVVALLTIILVTLEILRALHIIA